MSALDRDAVVMVTGAASGIGAATARHLEDMGVGSLVLLDFDGAGLADVAAALGHRASLHRLDVADAEAWDRLVEAGALVGLSHAVLCAGVSLAGPITEMAFEDWRRVMAANLDGAFLSLKAAMGAIAEGGAIVALSSVTGRKAVAGTAAYGASKAGLVQLVKTAALEGAERRVRVNALAPGGVKTPMFSGQPFFAEMVAAKGSEAAAWTAMAAGTPLGRFAEPGEVAAMAAWLLGPDAAMVTGTVVEMDGGYGL